MLVYQRVNGLSILVCWDTIQLVHITQITMGTPKSPRSCSILNLHLGVPVADEPISIYSIYTVYLSIPVHIYIYIIYIYTYIYSTCLLLHPHGITSDIPMASLNFLVNWSSFPIWFTVFHAFFKRLLLRDQEPGGIFFEGHRWARLWGSPQ